MTVDVLAKPAQPIVSNSEVGAYLSCQRKWFYAHYLNLEPVGSGSGLGYGESLVRGIIGHDILAEYYTVIQDGGSHEQAKSIAKTKLGQYIGLNPNRVEMLVFLGALLDQYWDYYLEDTLNWEIVNVEASYYYPFPGTSFAYGLRLDMLIKPRTGVFQGEYQIVDHKFIYNFKSQDELNLDAQLPKYIATVNALGIPVQRGIFNQLRYRTLKTKTIPSAERYQRSYVKPAAQRMRNIMSEHIKTSIKIMELKALTEEVVEDTVVRVLNPMVCRSCSFKALCFVELEGSDAKVMRAVEFKTNSYNEAYKELANDYAE